MKHSTDINATVKVVPIADGYMGLRELARYAGLSVNCLRGHLKASALPHYKLAGKILVRRSEFDAWMMRFRQVENADLSAMADELLKRM